MRQGLLSRLTHPTAAMTSLAPSAAFSHLSPRPRQLLSALCVAAVLASLGTASSSTTGPGVARELPGGGLHSDVSIACSGCAAVVRRVHDLLHRHRSQEVRTRTGLWGFMEWGSGFRV
jgi:hypothetical protein